MIIAMRMCSTACILWRVHLAIHMAVIANCRIKIALTSLIKALRAGILSVKTNGDESYQVYTGLFIEVFVLY